MNIAENATTNRLATVTVFVPGFIRASIPGSGSPERRNPVRHLPQMTFPRRKDRKREPGKTRIPFLIPNGAEGGI